jgi:hypothetical protein
MLIRTRRKPGSAKNLALALTVDCPACRRLAGDRCRVACGYHRARADLALQVRRTR